MTPKIKQLKTKCCIWRRLLYQSTTNWVVLRQQKCVLTQVWGSGSLSSSCQLRAPGQNTSLLLPISGGCSICWLVATSVWSLLCLHVVSPLCDLSVSLMRTFVMAFRPTWLIQGDLLISRPLIISHLQNLYHRNNVHSSQRADRDIPLGSIISPSHYLTGLLERLSING